MICTWIDSQCMISASMNGTGNHTREILECLANKLVILRDFEWQPECELEVGNWIHILYMRCNTCMQLCSNTYYTVFFFVHFYKFHPFNNCTQLSHKCVCTHNTHTLQSLADPIHTVIQYYVYDLTTQLEFCYGCYEKRQQQQQQKAFGSRISEKMR